MDTNQLINEPTSAAPRIFVQRGSHMLGPFNVQGAQARLAAGELANTDQAWIESESEWMSLDSILTMLAARPQRAMDGASSVRIVIHRDGSQFGPYSKNEAKRYLEAGNIVGSDRAKFEGATEWSSIWDVLQIAPPPPRTAPPPPLQSRSSKHGSSLFNMWLGMAILGAIGILITFSGGEFLSRFSTGMARKDREFVAVILSSLAYLGASGLGAVILYRGWSMVRSSRTLSPEKAVGFLFVPFFNFYWQFLAIRGLGVEINRRMENGQSVEPINLGLATAFCILMCVQGLFFWIPGIASLVSVASVIIGALLMRSYVDRLALLPPVTASRPE